jgi:hypothetical protein
MTVLVFSMSVVTETRTAEAQSAGESAKNKKKKGKGKDKDVSEADLLLVKEFHKKAMGLFEKGDYEGALVNFLKADSIKSTSFTLFSIARCYDNLYKYQDAYEYYQKYIDTGEKANYDEVIEAVARIESMPVILKVVTTPEGAGVFINGKEVTFQKTPIVSEVEPGTHTIVIRKKGFKDAVETVTIPFGGIGRIDVTLMPVTKPAAYEDSPSKKPKDGKEGKDMKGAGDIQGKDAGKTTKGAGEAAAPGADEKGAGKKKEGKKKDKETVKVKKKVRVAARPVPMSLSAAAGATVSTSKTMGSYVDISLGLFFRIKQGFVGLGIDNLFFLDGYLLAAYPAGGYTVRIWRDLSLSFAAGFGAAYLHAFKEGYNEDGAVIIETGSHWDLVAHVDVKLRYKLGPVMLQAIPVHADVLLGVGSVEPAPLAQFAFLLGVAVDFM